MKNKNKAIRKVSWTSR